MTTLEATFDGEQVKVYANGRRLRILWSAAAVMWAVVVWDWRRGW